MKTRIGFFVLLLVILISCEKHPNPYSNPVLRTGGDLMYSFSDFEFYDSSSHILYFKDSHPELTDQSVFSFYVDTTFIYKGSFLPGYSSLIPSDPYVYKWPSFYPDFVIRLEFACPGTDPRNDYRLMLAFKNHNLLHSGLNGEIKEVKRIGSQLKFSFEITNKDRTDLLILDPEKMGPNLFHYFTNGPVLYNMSQKKIYEYKIESEAPSPFNKWDPDWLTVLKSGESQTITFYYPIDVQYPSGYYRISFLFPGLFYQISQDQLYQSDKRIWLGNLTLTAYLNIH